MRYAKTAEIKNGQTIVFMNEGEMVTSSMYMYKDGNYKKDLYCEVLINDEIMKLRVNIPSRKLCEKAYGIDRKKWIGKTAKLSIEAVPDSPNKMVVVIPTDDKKVLSPEEIIWNN